MKRRYFKDRYNGAKVWEVTKLVGGYYLRQFIAGKQFGSGIKTTKSKIEEIGIFAMEEI